MMMMMLPSCTCWSQIGKRNPKSIAHSTQACTQPISPKPDASRTGLRKLSQICETHSEEKPAFGRGALFFLHKKPIQAPFDWIYPTSTALNAPKPHRNPPRKTPHPAKISTHTCPSPRIWAAPKLVRDRWRASLFCERNTLKLQQPITSHKTIS